MIISHLHLRTFAVAVLTSWITQGVKTRHITFPPAFSEEVVQLLNLDHFHGAISLIPYKIMVKQLFHCMKNIFTDSNDGVYRPQYYLEPLFTFALEIQTFPSDMHGKWAALNALHEWSWSLLWFNILPINVCFLCNQVAFKGIYGEGLMDAITLGNSTQSISRDECIWKRGGDRDPCPDPDVKYYFYGSDGRSRVGEEVRTVDSFNWVRESRHDPTKHTVILVHGYAGISDELPMGVLRDAYLTNGTYNVYTVDWSRLSRVPCYAAAVHNLRPVARCLAGFLTSLRDAGVEPATTTCVGHSLGAHVCGVASNYLLFRMYRIIGLDPARPLIRSQLKGRLDAGDAKVVQVIHTSSTFGDARRSGHVDFCINGARVQPFCLNTTNESLCSHIRSVCYLAESLDGNRARIGVPCLRRCLTGSVRPSWDRRGLPIPLGHQTPDWVDGLFCISNEEAPYCPSREHPLGSPLCCVPPRPLLTSNLV